MEQNPYWLINKVPNEDTRYRTLLNLSVKYKFNDLFSICLLYTSPSPRDRG